MPKAQRHFRHKHTSHPSPLPQPWQRQSASGQKPQHPATEAQREVLPCHPPVEKDTARCYGSFRPLPWLCTQFLFLIPKKPIFHYFFICCASAAIYSIACSWSYFPHICVWNWILIPKCKTLRCCCVLSHTSSSREGSVDHFGSDWNISITITWIAMKFCSDIHDPHRMNPNYFLHYCEVDIFVLHWNFSLTSEIFLHLPDELTQTFVHSNH